MITPLPKWVLVNKFPAFYDTESLTAVEQTARLYGKMNELIESYNKYVEEINKAISDLETEKNNDVKEFICRISCLTDNYINTVDMKIAHQDRKIAEVYAQFSEDIINTFKLFLSDLHSSGLLDDAIYTALDNIKVKVDNFIAECEQFKAEMTADYESIKAGLNADYTEKKAALEGDYNTVKAGLNADYTEKKAALEGDYNTVKAGLYDDYEETKIQLMDDVAGYTDMYDNKGVVLYDGSIGDDSKNTEQLSIIVPNLLKYKVVMIEFEHPRGAGETVLCSVSKLRHVIGENVIRKVYLGCMGRPRNGQQEDGTTQFFLSSVEIRGKYENDESVDCELTSCKSVDYFIQRDPNSVITTNFSIGENIKRIIGII